MTDIDWTQLEADRNVVFLQDMHRQTCFEAGDHPDEVDTPFSLGSDALSRLLTLEAYALRARRVEAAADELARLLDGPNEICGDASTYHYEWHRVDAALAAYQDAKGDA